jgi:hypothetical protein
MPITGASTRTTHAADLKELYTLPPVRALNDRSFLHNTLAKEKATTSISGKYITYPVTLRRSLGSGARTDGGTLPSAISEVIDDAQFNVQYNYHAVEWTEALEVASRNNEGAFEKVISMKMKNLGTDMAKTINRQFFNPAYGRLATCNTNDADGLVFTVDSTQYIEVGDVVDIVDASTGVPITNATARLVASKTSTTFTIDTNASGYPGTNGTGNVNVAGTEYVVKTGSAGAATTTSTEIPGLRAAVATGRTYAGINSSTYAEWDGNTVAASSAAIGESLVEQLLDEVGERGRGEPDLGLTTRGVRRRLADEFASQRRWVNEKATDLTAGYKTISVSGLDIVIDDDCPKKHLFVGKKDTAKVLQATAPGFIESEAGDGAKVELKDGSTAGTKTAVFQAWYRYHLTLAVTDPGCWGAITDGADD